MLWRLNWLICVKVVFGYLDNYSESTSNTEPLSHCQSSTVLSSTTLQRLITSHLVTPVTVVHFTVNVGGTVCLQLAQGNYNYSNSTVAPNSLLVSVSYNALEQHYPIQWQYQFGLPSITTNCHCRCASVIGCEPQNCTSSDQSVQCSWEHHNYLHGCSNQQSRWCCTGQVHAANDTIYTAFGLGAPAQSAILTVTVHYLDTVTQSARVSQQVLRAPLSSEQTLSLHGNEHLLRARVLSTPNEHALQQSEYYIQEGAKQPLTGIPINAVYEHNMMKMGWLRRYNGQWHIRNAAHRLRHAHILHPMSCADHKFAQSFALDQFVLGDSDTTGHLDHDTDTWHHGQTLTELEPWVAQVNTSLHNRRLVLTQRVQHALMVDLLVHSDVQHLVTQLVHADRLAMFNASIRLDLDRAPYLNISLCNASGTLMGELHSAQTVASPVALTFSMQLVPRMQQTHVLRLPVSIHDARLVCLQRSNDATGKKWCSLAKYSKSRNRLYRLDDGWTVQKGNCGAHCDENMQIWETMLVSLDYTNWNRMTMVERVLLMLKYLFVIIGLLLLMALVRLILLPLCKCAFNCDASSSKKHVLEIKMDKHII